MYDSSGVYSSSEPRMPAWLARDLGVHPSTRLGDFKGASTRSKFKSRLLSARRRRGDEVIATIPLFEGLSATERRLASSLSTTVDLPAGAILVHEGADGAEFFVVLEGQVEVSQGGQVVALRGPGSPLGEMALLEGRPRTATLQAKTPVSTLVSGKQEFKSLLTAVPAISERLRAITAQRRAA